MLRIRIAAQATAQEAAMSDLVTIDVQDHVADVRLNRPEKMNAVNRDMWRAIGEAGEALIGDRAVRAVVLLSLIHISEPTRPTT